MLMSGCGKKASDEIDFGTLSDSVYRNKYFGFSVTLPKDWSVQDQKAQRRLMKKGTNQEEEASLQKILDSATFN